MLEAPSVGGFERTQILQDMVQAVSDVAPHCVIGVRYIPGAESFCQIVVKISGKMPLLGCRVIKPIEDKNLLLFDCPQQSRGASILCDAHMELHVIGMNREEEARIFTLRRASDEELVQVFRSAKELVLLARSHLLAT